MMKEYWSVDGESYHYDSLHDLILDNDYLVVGDTVYKGGFINLTPEDIISSSDLYDIVYDRMYDYVGEFADSFDILNEDMNSVVELLHKFIEKNGIGAYWKPVGQGGNFEEYIITEHDVEPFKDLDKDD